MLEYPRFDKKRPGIYLTIVNLGHDIFSAIKAAQASVGGNLTVTYDAETKTVKVTAPGVTVTHDGAGTVKISGLTAAVSHDGSTVKIGG